MDRDDVGEFSGFDGVTCGDRQFAKPALRDGGHEQRWVDLNLPEGFLDGDFPDRGRADMDFVVGIEDARVGRLRELAIACQPPGLR
jgi:hypothetical protein